MSIAKRVVSRPVLTATIFALIAVVGFYTLSDVAIDLFPSIDRPVLMVSTGYQGAGPETVEKSVTKPLESALVNVGGLLELSSTSSEGSSIITLEFDYGVDLEAKTNDIRDKLDRVRDRLPEEAGSPQIMQFDPSSMPIMRIALRGNRTREDLRAIAEKTVLDRLEQVEGVSEASVMGGRTAAVRVELSQNRLEAFGLTITGIAGTLAKQNLELGGGSIADGSKNYSIRTTGEYVSLKDIAGTVAAVRNGVGIRLSDLGTVTLGYADETTSVYINGEAGVYVSVRKQSGWNSVSVADAVYARLGEIQAELPSDVTLEIIDDDTDQIRGTIDELVSVALQGAALAMAILFIFLRSVKSTIIIGISIPFSILVTLLAMRIAGITLNMMTLTGLILGVGMIVDASIVILENIHSYRERGAKPDVSAVLGSQEMMSAIISSTLTTMCVFLPMYFFKNRLGMIGQLFQEMTFTVVIALFSSLLVALFLVPVLASKYLPIDTRRQKPLKNRVLIVLDKGAEAVLGGITAAYRRVLVAAVRHRAATVILVAAALVGSILAVPKMHITMTPPMGDQSVTLNVSLPLGSRYEDTKEVLLMLQEFAMEEIRGAKHVIVNVGSSSGFGGSASGSHKGELTIRLDASDPAADSSDVVKEKLRSRFADFPNATLSFRAGMGANLAGGSAVDILLKADDLDEGIAAAKELMSIIETKVSGVSDVSMDLTEGLPQVEVVIDRERAYDFGLTISGIAGEISAAANGTTATTFRARGNEYSVVLMLREEDRAKLPDLERIFVASSKGTLVPVSSFAKLEKGLGPVDIKRENQARIIHVTGELQDGIRSDQAEAAIKAAVAEYFVAGDGVSLGFEGQWGDIMDQTMTFVLIITMAVLLVFGVMAGQYESFRDPVINLFTIPLMFIGVVAIHLITGQSLSTFTMIGLVMLAGIVVNNGIVLVDYTNLLVGRGIPVRDACITAGTSRLRPVLMTTLTTILGLIPMALFPGENSRMIQPIGLTVIGGLVSATLITLFFIPVVYSLFNEKRGKTAAETQEAAA